MNASTVGWSPSPLRDSTEKRRSERGGVSCFTDGWFSVGAAAGRVMEIDGINNQVVNINLGAKLH